MYVRVVWVLFSVFKGVLVTETRPPRFSRYLYGVVGTEMLTSKVFKRGEKVFKLGRKCAGRCSGPRDPAAWVGGHRSGSQ